MCINVFAATLTFDRAGGVEGCVFPYVYVSRYIIIIITIIIIIYIMHIPFSIQYCSKGVAELIPHEDKCWSNVRVQ